MDRILEKEFVCDSCESNYKLIYDKSNSDIPDFCPFCGSTVEEFIEDNEDDESSYDSEDD